MYCYISYYYYYYYLRARLKFIFIKQWKWNHLDYMLGKTRNTFPNKTMLQTLYHNKYPNYSLLISVLLHLTQPLLWFSRLTIFVHYILYKSISFASSLNPLTHSLYRVSVRDGSLALEVFTEARKKIVVIKRHAHGDYVEKCKRINHTLHFHTPFYFAKASNYTSLTFIPFVCSKLCFLVALSPPPLPSPPHLCISSHTDVSHLHSVPFALLALPTSCSHAIYLIIIRYT